MNQDLNNLSDWLRANKLSLNIKKTEVLLFVPPSKKPNFKYKLKLDGVKLRAIDSVKYLGLQLDDKLKWNSHISQLKLKLSRAIGILSKLRNKVPLNILKMVYHSIFNSYILYGLQIWSQNSQSIRSTIQKLQDRAIRKITFSDINTDINKLYKDLKIFKTQ